MSITSQQREHLLDNVAKAVTTVVIAMGFALVIAMIVATL